MKKLSVIVPIYNAADTLCRCIDSIVNQDYPALEIVLIDDGSTDSSLEICEDYAKRDSRVVVHHKENAGLVAARKSGVEIATGEYIGFVDSDDFVDVDMYSALMREANEADVDMVIGGIRLDYPTHSTVVYNRVPAGRYTRASIEEQIIPRMLMRHGFYRYGIIPGVVVKVFKKELIWQSLKNVTDDLTLGEDVAITSFSVMSAQGISVVEHAAYHYVQTDASMIRGYNPKRLEAVRRMYRCVEKIENAQYKKQLGACVSCILYGVLADYVRCDLLTRGEKRKSIKAALTDEVFVNAMRVMDLSGWPRRDKIKVWLMKHKMICVLTYILAR